MEKVKKNMEFSKKIFTGVTVGVVFISIFTCYMVWVTKDMSPLMYLIPCVFTELGVSTGFYYNKAKLENSLKIRKSLGVPIDTTQVEAINYQQEITETQI